MVYGEGEEPTLNDMKRYLRGELPDYMVPSIVMALPTMPLTPNGKLDRGALPDPFSASQAQAPHHDPPTTETEKLLAEIWRSVLNCERVDAGDNFFDSAATRCCRCGSPICWNSAPSIGWIRALCSSITCASRVDRCRAPR